MNTLRLLLYTLLAGFSFAQAEEPKAIYFYEWKTGKNNLPDDVFFTIDNQTRTVSKLLPTGEILNVMEISKDNVEPESLAFDHWGEPSHGYRLSLRMENLKIPLGSPISATLVIRNISTNLLRIAVWVDVHDYQFVFIDGNKQLVPLTIYGKQLLEQNAVFDNTSVGLPPRSQRKYGFQLDKLYDVHATGEYLIYAKRRIHIGGGKYSEVISGTAIIQVVDAPNTAGQANPGNTTASASSSPTAPANSGAPVVAGTLGSANPRQPSGVAETKSAANNPKNLLPPASKAAASKTPAQLAQAETGGWSTRDWVYGLLVLGVVLGLGWYLFRARPPQPRH